MGCRLHARVAPQHRRIIRHTPKTSMCCHVLRLYHPVAKPGEDHEAHHKTSRAEALSPPAPYHLLPPCADAAQRCRCPALRDLRVRVEGSALCTLPV